MKNKIQTWEKIVFLAILCFLSDTTTYAQYSTSGEYPENLPDTISYAQRFIQRIGVEAHAGYTFPTNSFLKGDNYNRQKIKNAYSGHLKYSFQFRPHTAVDQAYIGAYQGIGIGYYDWGNKQEIGNPIAVYAFQGGRIAKFSPRLSLNYEWNFGASFGWKPYDEIENPQNKIIGSKVNAYLSVNVYFKWALNPTLDLMVGAAGNHFSNGNTKYPNSGLNNVDAKIGVVYNFNRKTDELIKSWQRPIVPIFPRHISYDLTLFGSWRKKAVNVPGGQVPAPGNYTVLGFNFAPMYNLGYKFRTGVSLDGVYDHSANITADPNGEFYIPSIDKQMSLGVSARGELVMPYFTVGIGLGANILHSGNDLKSFYQILALKVNVSRNSYLHIGYNLKDFHEPNYLMLGIGYRFNNKCPRLF